MPPFLTRDGDALAISLNGCRGSEFSDVLAKVKDIPGRRYDPDRKLWIVPGEPATADRVVYTLQPQMEDDVRDWLSEQRTQLQQELTTPLPQDAKLKLSWSTGRAPWQPEYIEIAGEREPFNGLMQHQRPVIDIAADSKKLLICDDMGGGKTGMMLSTWEEYRLRNPKVPDGPKLVVAPNSVKSTWEDELDMWFDSPPYQVIDATSPASRHKQLQAAIRENAWCIVNWEQIRVKKVMLEVKRRSGTIAKKAAWVMKEPLFEFPWATEIDWNEWDPKLVTKLRTTPQSEAFEWAAVYADEVHRGKSRKALQTRGLWHCRADGGLMLGASGTPLMNSPAELWSILHWLWPSEYTSYWRFHDDYCDEIEGYFGRILIGVKNPDALRFELKGRLVRRTQAQMNLGLKGKKRIPVPVKLGVKQRKLYDAAETKLWVEVEQAAKAGDAASQKLYDAAAGGASASQIYKLPNGAAKTVRLRQILETPANLGGEDDSAVLDACVEKIEDSRPHQWAVFCEFKQTTECLRERLEKRGLTVAVYHGDVDPKERTLIRERYQRGEIDVIVGTIKAMKEGITLTAGFNQFWVSRDWTPDVNEQGEDRQNRIGQTEQVLIWIAQPKDTVATDKVAPKNKLKERIVRTVLPKDAIQEAEA